MQPLDNSFQVFGNGIFSSSSADANSYCSSGKKIMTYDWTVLKTLLFLVTPFFVMLVLADTEDDDDDQGGGLMQPVYAPSPS
jgi:hypothetical protein